MKNTDLKISGIGNYPETPHNVIKPLHDILRNNIEILSTTFRNPAKKKNLPSKKEISSILDSVKKDEMYPSDWVLRTQIEFQAGMKRETVKSINAAMDLCIASLNYNKHTAFAFAQVYGALGKRKKALKILQKLPDGFFKSILTFDVDFLIEIGTGEILQRNIKYMDVCCEYAVSDYAELISVYRKLGAYDKIDACIERAAIVAAENSHAENYAFLAVIMQFEGRAELDRYIAKAGEFAEGNWDWPYIAVLYLYIADNMQTVIDSIRNALNSFSHSTADVLYAAEGVGEHFCKYLVEINFLSASDGKLLTEKFYSAVIDVLGGSKNFLEQIKNSFYTSEVVNIVRKMFQALEYFDESSECLELMQPRIINCRDLGNCVEICLEHKMYAEAVQNINEIKKLAINSADYCVLSKSLLLMQDVNGAVTQACNAEAKVLDAKDIEICRKLWFELGSNAGVRRCIQKLLPGKPDDAIDPLRERLDEFIDLVKATNPEDVHENLK